MDNAKLADALAGATVEQLREDAFRAGIIASNLRVQVENIRGGTDDMPQVVIPVMLENAAMHDRLAALALAVAAMQERATGAIVQRPERPHVIFWLLDGTGEATWMVGDAGDNAERTLPAALAELLRSLGRDA